MRLSGPVGLCLLVTSSALAAPKPLSGTEATPPRFVDESSVFMQVGNSDGGYWVDVEAEVFGLASKDRVRLDVKRGAKLVATAACRWNDSRTAGLSAVQCRAAADKVLKGQGPLDAALILEEDATDKEYLLRTFKVKVKQWEKENFQIEADDLLATAHLVRRELDPGAEPVLRFWIAARAGFGAVLRCTVDGKPLPAIEGSVDSDKDLTADVMGGKERKTWIWTRATFSAQWWNVAPDKSKSHPSYVYLSAHPGLWECQLRRDGIALREFRFNVLPGGQVESNAMQKAPDAAPLVPGSALIDVRIPKGNGLDQRIKPAALKKSHDFGLAWPKHDSVKALVAALPPAFENATPPPGQRKVGKRLSGAEATPPRFVDESRTSVRLSRNGDGYGFQVLQGVGGLSFAKANSIRLDWQQGSKVIATTKCGGEAKDAEDIVDCDYDAVPLTAKGPIEARLIEYDDTDGNEYLLRSYKVNVVKFTSFGDAVWQIVPDDVLATAWAKQTEYGVKFRFWVAMENPRPELRCTVDGKKLPDIELSMQTSDPSIEAEVVQKGTGDVTKYVWQYVGGDSEIRPGPLPKGAAKSSDRVEYLAHYPGKWDCAVRHNGKSIRQLLFTVNDKGFIEADPAQLPGPPGFPGVVPLDLRFGKDILDVRVRPDALKKSRGFGLPWPKPPTKSFPPKSGLADPK